MVRYYTRIGLLRPRRDPGNSYKVFEVEDLKALERHLVRADLASV